MKKKQIFVSIIQIPNFQKQAMFIKYKDKLEVDWVFGYPEVDGQSGNQIDLNGEMRRKIGD